MADISDFYDLDSTLGDEEIMIGGKVTDNHDDYVKFDEEVLSAFS